MFVWILSCALCVLFWGIVCLDKSPPCNFCLPGTLCSPGWPQIQIHLPFKHWNLRHVPLPLALKKIFLIFVSLCVHKPLYVCAGQRVVFKRHVFLHWEPGTERSQGNMLAWQWAPSLAKASLRLFLRQHLSLARTYLLQGWPANSEPQGSTVCLPSGRITNLWHHMRTHGRPVFSSRFPAAVVDK